MKWIVGVWAALILLALVTVFWVRDGEHEDENVEVPSSATTAMTADDSKRVAQSPSKLKKLSSRKTAQKVATPAGGSAGTASDDRRAQVRINCRNLGAKKSSDGSPAAEEVEGETKPKGQIDIASSVLDKTACYEAARALKAAWAIFDVRPTEAVWYSTVRPLTGSTIQEIIAPQLCSADWSFDKNAETKFDLVAVTAKASAKIFVGEQWVSDGTVVSPLTESQYFQLTSLLKGRQRQNVGSGQNMSRATFDKRLENQSFNRMAADAEVQRQREQELRSAQQGLPSDCAQ